MVFSDFFEEVGPQQNPHDGFIHAAQRNIHSGAPYPVYQERKGLFSRGVHVVDTIRYDNDMLQTGFCTHQFSDAIFQVTGVGEEKRAVEPNQRHVLAFLKAEFAGIAEGRVFAPGKGCHFRPHALVKKNQQGENHTYFNALFQVRCKREGQEKADDGDGPVIPLCFPGMDEPGDIYQADNRHHNDRGQDRLGKVVEKRREKT